MLFNLLLASIRIILFFFCFVLFSMVSYDSYSYKNAKLKLALAVLTGVSITQAKETIDTFVADRTMKFLSK